jgi:hypothetical protein
MPYTEDSETVSAFSAFSFAIFRKPRFIHDIALWLLV